MQASREWLYSSSAEFSAGSGQQGVAHLRHYSADYREWGEGPPIVLVPGLAGGWRLLGPLAAHLAKHCRVLTYQLRGEDDCFCLRHRFGLSDLGDDLAEFIEWHGLECPTVLGVSFGGVLALEMAARHPARLGRLIVQGVGSHYAAGLLPQVATTVLSRYPLPSDNAFVNQFFNLLFGGKQHKGPLFHFVTRQCWQTDQSVMAHRLRLVEQFDVRPRLGNIRVPTLVLTGDRDVLVAEENVRELCDGIANVKQVHLPRGGHLAFLTHVERVAGEVVGFLNATTKVTV